MDAALIALIIVICYKAKQGDLEEGLIKGTKIFGYIYLIFAIVLQTTAIVWIPESRGLMIIGLLITIALLVIVSNIKKIAERIMYKDDGWR